jgi:hypothetical protein
MVTTSDAAMREDPRSCDGRQPVRCSGIERVSRPIILALCLTSCAGRSSGPPPPDAGPPAPDASAPAPITDGPIGTIDARTTVDVARAPDGPAPRPPDASTGVGPDAGDLGGPSRCPGGFTVCESFEATAPGALPAGWARRPGFLGKSMGVSTDDAARGTHALKVEGGDSGSQFMELKNGLGALAMRHWGRIFFRVKVPAPWPPSGVLHGDIVQHLGPHPGGGTNGVRWGIVENTAMKFQWIYNVQPTEGEGEFADGTAYTYSWPGRWQCLEWRYDQPAQQGELWLDGTAVPIAVGKSHPPEIPVFTSLGVGWANYQPAGAGFTVYIDEVAFHDSRIGCAN